MPGATPELKIELTPAAAGGGAYRVTCTLPAADGAADPPQVDGAVVFNPAALNGSASDPVKHGAALGEALFADPNVREAWKDATAVARTRDQPLRVRLRFQRYDLTARRVRWEALAGPDGTPLLLSDQKIRFARDLISADGYRVRIRVRPAVRALVAVASPEDIGNVKVGGRAFEADDRFDAAAEVEGVKAALAGMGVTVLARAPGAAGPPTFDAIVGHLRQGYDLFVLFAHGVHEGDVPRLLLEDDGGKGKEADGNRLAGEVQKLWHRPALVVLASCQSTGTPRPITRATDLVREDAADTTLSARLGEAGVGAVVAMHGNVFQETARAFVSVFLKGVAGHGELDRAAADARSVFATAVTARDKPGYPDYWAPVLSSRLTDNRLWLTPAQGPAAQFDGWPRLLRKLAAKQCIPVLGSGLPATLVGATREQAAVWAAGVPFGVPEESARDIPQIAQYLSVTQGADVVREMYVDLLRNELARRTGRPPSGPGVDALLADLSAAAARAAADNPAEPYALLARLGLPLYLMTTPDDALTDALRAALGPAPAGTNPAEWGPVRQVCDWLGEPPVDADGQVVNAWPADPVAPPAPRPTRPLVCYLGGHLSRPESLVLSENDYFRFLVQLAVTNSRAPASVITPAFTNADFLFLGFRLDDWDFRTFIEVFMGWEGVQSRYASRKEKGGAIDVAVQIDPADGRGPTGEQVRKFLEELFRRNSDDDHIRLHIKIFWGGLSKFFEDLYDQWPANP